MPASVADIRKDYRMQSLLEKDVAANPVEQFDKWWKEAIDSRIEDVNAMTLATATKEGIPSARIVLLKGYDHEGFVFYTNYNSHKGKQLAENPSAALVFFWKELERQVRIEGIVQKTAEGKSDEYFASRPAGSRIGAWASPQSDVIKERLTIEERVLHYQEQYAGGVIPRPPHWGGYVLKPTAFEFWQGRSSRLHDRLLYVWDPQGWRLERLAP